MKRLAVIPSDPIEEYIQKGYSEKWLGDYYNPCKFFDEVFLLSPLEKELKEFGGMKVIYTPENYLKGRIKSLGIDVVRAYGGNWASRAACEHKVNGVPVVVSVHDQRPERLYESIKKADIVIAVSHVVKNLVLSKFHDYERVWVLPNRVDLNVMTSTTPIQIDKLDGFKYKILFVGRLSVEKNLKTLIRSVALLGQDYGLCIVGHGDNSEYQDLAVNQGVLHQCQFVDRVPNEDLPRYFSWCNCMCMPSLVEGFPKTSIEAMACNVVFVTSNIAPMNEYVENGFNGVLIDNYQIPSFVAEAIKKVCEDESLRNNIKNNVRKSVECFEKSTIDKMEMEYYQQILTLKDKGTFNRNIWQIITNTQIQKPPLQEGEHFKTAVKWVKANSIYKEGIIVNSSERLSYPEVSGYFIPSLISINEIELAKQYAEFLIKKQQVNGAYLGVDGKEYIFDSAQVLRGLVAASYKWDKYKPYAKKTADYLVSTMLEDGCLPAIYSYEIPAAIQMYAVPALKYASELLNDAHYMNAAQKAVGYYKRLPDILETNRLTHFLAYILDGFIEMNEEAFVKNTVKDIFDNQNMDGSINAFPNVDWVCSTGVAQFGIIAHKLGMINEAKKCFTYMKSIQNPYGGFLGGYGLNAKYFQKDEISWANKFFIDLSLLLGEAK